LSEREQSKEKRREKEGLPRAAFVSAAMRAGS
jgi:hypothetical protein